MGVDDLGLIYNVTLHDTVVVVEMTLTTPSCPASDVILNAVRAAVERVAGVTAVDMRLVWDPGWTPEMVTLRGRQQLGWT